MPSMTGAEALVRALAREGVEIVIGLPGNQIMTIFDALQHHPEIRLVVVRHEQAATYMADGYARTTGKVAPVLVVPGPGVLNTLAGLGTAYAASSPVLLIATDVDSANLGGDRGVLHEVKGQIEVLRPLTKWCTLVSRAQEIPSALHTALAEMRRGRPRPVALDVPWDLFGATAEVEMPEPEGSAVDPPDPAAIEEAAKLLKSARRPLLWAGGGVLAADASRELTELAQLLQAPVITTHQAKGAIAEDHPLSLGVFYYGQGPGYRALPQADVVLAVGSRLTLPVQVDWAFGPHQQLIQVNADPAEIGRNFPATVGIAADARAALGALAAALGSKGSQSQWTLEEVEGIRAETLRELREMSPVHMEMVEVLSRELAEDAIVVADATILSHWCHLALPVRQPRSYLTASYFATLGWAYPAALGAKLGNPGRQVVTLLGDGGFLYNPQELATAVQEGIGVVALVFRDGAFGSSLNDQRRQFQGRVFGTRFHNPDFVRLAESFGAKGISTSGPEELASALHEALRENGPTLVEIPLPTLAPPFHFPVPQRGAAPISRLR